jgi:phosphotriesterase-related protein
VKRILTVRGPIEPEELGITLSHEHLFVDAREHWTEPETATGALLRNAPVTPELLSQLRQRPFSTTLDNLLLGDEGLTARELTYLVGAGGSAVVDLTSIGLRRDPVALLRTSRVTGLHVIMGGGCYVERAHPAWVSDASVDALARRFADDVLVGADGTGIRTGIIGEIGVSGFAKGSRTKQGHMTAQEEKVLRAGGRAAVETGAAVAVHVDFRSRGAFDVLDVLEQEGLETDRVVICHMDLVEDLDYHRAVAQRGAYVEYSSVGREFYDASSGRSAGSDRTRVELIGELVRGGFSDKILMSHDVCMKTDLHTYGGNGFDFVPTAFADRLLKNGLEPRDVGQILIGNPRRLLTMDFEDRLLARIEEDTVLAATA